MKRITAAARRFQENATLIAAQRLLFKSLDGMGVPSTAIAEVAETGSGGTPSRGVSEYFGGDIPWVKSGDLTDGLIFEVEEHITESGLENSSARVFPSGTIVVALYGATVGKTGILTFAAASNQAVCAVMPKDGRITNEFIYWFLRHKRQDFLDASFGGAQPNISQKTLRETIIPVPSLEIQRQLCQFFEIVERRQSGDRSNDLPELPPPLSEQRRIVAKIEQLAAKIEEARGVRENSIQKLNSLLGSYTHHCFASELQRLCEIIPLGSISEIKSGVTLGRELAGPTIELPYLRVANVQDGYLNLNQIKTVRIRPEEKEKWQLIDGDLLLTEGGDWDKLGRGTIWHDEIQDCMHQNHIFRVRLNQNEYDPRYVLTLTRSSYGKEYFQDASKQTTNLASINQQQLKAFPVYKLPLDEQRRIVAYLDGLQAQVDRLKALQAQTAAELEALLPAILDRAFKGEL